jgi:hypothetical protein
MRKQPRTASQIKLAGALDKVYDNLIAYKKKMNSELVVMRNRKITRITADIVLTQRENKIS